MSARARRSGGAEPHTIVDAAFAPRRLLDMQTRNSAAYKGVMALLMKFGCLDFKNGDSIELTENFAEEVDIHHIFPRAYCLAQKLPERLWNSIVNKTPLTAETNRILGGRAPSIYLGTIVSKIKDHSAARLDGFAKTHLVRPDLLRGDDFHGFLRDRASRLLDEIERAMGKAVAGRESEETVAAFGGSLASTANAPVGSATAAAVGG